MMYQFIGADTQGTTRILSVFNIRSCHVRTLFRPIIAVKTTTSQLYFVWQWTLATHFVGCYENDIEHRYRNNEQMYLPTRCHDDTCRRTLIDTDIHQESKRSQNNIR